MSAVNAFVAMFIVQIVVMTVVYPSRLIKRLRELDTRYPKEQFPQLWPPGYEAAERLLVTLYWGLNTVVAVAGLALLYGLFTYMRRPDWDDDPVAKLVVAFFFLELIPTAVVFVTAAKLFKKWRNWFQVYRRTATLERRGLFDFVSPFVVVLTLLCYPLLIGLVTYVERDDLDDGSADALVMIGAITLMYAMFAFGMYASLYGKRNPFQTHEARIRAMAISVKGSVYTCLVAVVYISLNLMLTMLGLPSWKPFAMSAFLVICGVSSFTSILNAIPRELKLDGLRPTLPAERTASSPS